MAITTRAYLSDFCRSFCFLRLYEIIKNGCSSRAGAYWSDNHIFDHHSTRKKPWPLDHFRRIKNGILSVYAAARNRTNAPKPWYYWVCKKEIKNFYQFLYLFWPKKQKSKLKTAFFTVRQNYLNTWRMMGGSIKTLREHWPRPRPRHFFTSSKYTFGIRAF